MDEDLKKRIEEDWEYLKTVLSQGGNHKVALIDFEEDLEELGINVN